MNRKTDQRLNSCIDLLEKGMTVEECLSRFPKQERDDVRPLLEIAQRLHQLSPATAAPEAVASGKRRMLQALEEKTQARAQDRARDRAGRTRLRGLRIAFAVAAVILVFVFIGMGRHLWLNSVVVQAATVQSASGTVELLYADGETWTPASEDIRLTEGARIRTAATSRADLVFFDGSTVTLQEKTELTLRTVEAERDGDRRRIALYQPLGATQSAVQPLPDAGSHFKIESPTALAVVQGTEFTVTVATDGTTEVRVQRGRVNVTAAETSVDVEPGQATRVRPNQPPDAPWEQQGPPEDRGRPEDKGEPGPPEDRGRPEDKGEPGPPEDRGRPEDKGEPGPPEDRGRPESPGQSEEEHGNSPSDKPEREHPSPPDETPGEGQPPQDPGKPDDHPGNQPPDNPGRSDQGKPESPPGLDPDR